MIDAHSATWRELERQLLAGIEQDREALCWRGTPHDTSEYLRGRVALARELLALAHEPAPADLTIGYD